MGWTPGMLEHLCRLEDRAAEAQTKEDRQKYIDARLSALNYLYCWCSDTRQTRWPIVNRHIWRRLALYHGGDCFLAGFPGAVPHQRLWQYRQPKPNCKA